MAHHTRPTCVVTAEGVLQSFAPMPVSGHTYAFPEPANENLKVKADWMTPAEAMQAIQRIKRRLQRENYKAHTLLASANRRRIWDEVQACEQCLRWMYFRTTSNNK